LKIFEILISRNFAIFWRWPWKVWKNFPGACSLGSLTPCLECALWGVWHLPWSVLSGESDSLPRVCSPGESDSHPGVYSPGKSNSLFGVCSLGSLTPSLKCTPPESQPETPETSCLGTNKNESVNKSVICWNMWNINSKILLLSKT